MTPEAVLAWKLRVFTIGAFLMLLGVVLDRRPLILASIGVLAVGLVLRIIHRKPPPQRHASWDEPDGE